MPEGPACARRCSERASTSRFATCTSSGRAAITTLQTGQMMPDDWKAQLAGVDAIYFGAVGWPATVPDHVSLWGSLLKFRREFDQYINLRPARTFAGRIVSARRAQARRHRYRDRAREHRGRIFLGRRRDVRRHAARSRHATGNLHAPWRGARAEVCFRSGSPAAPQACDRRDQEQRHRDQHAMVGCARRGSRAAGIRT